MKRITILAIFISPLLILSAFIGVLHTEAEQITIPNETELTLLNQFGGHASSVVKYGDYAYVGMGPRLVVMDIQNPTQPNVLYQTAVLSGSIRELTLVSPYLYASVGGDLVIFDLTQPTIPTILSVSHTPAYLYNMAISGTILYISERTVWENGVLITGGMHILDISNPVFPTELGYYQPANNPDTLGIAVKGNYVYLGKFNNSEIIDISDPTNPTFINSFASYYDAPTIIISGTYLYLGAGVDGLVIYDLTNPESPNFVHELSQPIVSEISIVGSTIYLANRVIYLYDISDPQMPNFLGQYVDEPLSLNGSIELVIDQEYLYTAMDSKGFQIIDISNPITPTKVGGYNPLGFVGGIAFDDTHLYVLNIWDGLNIYDLNNPISPTLVGFYSTQRDRDIQVKDNYAFTLGIDSLKIIDVSNPISPTLVTQHPITLSVRELALQGNYAYITAGVNKLIIVDISDPNNPATVSLTNVGLPAREVAVSNQYAFVGYYEPEIVILDISNPVTPTVASTYGVPNGVYAIAVENNYAYLTEGGSGLHIVDISNIVSPTLVGFYPLDLYANNGDMEVVNGKVYASYDDQIFVLDATTPTSPTLITHYQSSNRLWDLDLHNSYIYLAHDVHGLTILGEENITVASISDSEVIEGNTGMTTTMSFTVTLDATYTDTITMMYETVAGTAVPFTDYIPISGTLAFAPGELTKTLQVPIIGDELDEPDETFTINLSNPVNATISDGQGIGTILDDDDAPQLAIADVVVPEGDGMATFMVTLTAVSGKPITVTYQTADITAIAHLDYTPISGTLTFAPGELAKTLQVLIIGDELDEPGEIFTINLSNPVNTTIADGQGIGTILDDDAAPELAIGDVAVSEGDGIATFVVTLTAVSGKPITVTYQTADLTAITHLDYTPISGTLTFAPGELTKTLKVPIIGDELDEPDETFTVNLSNAAIADGQAIGTIVDDDDEIQIGYSVYLPFVMR